MKRLEPQWPTTVLIVDDNALMREALGYLLTSVGYRVLEASDGDEGVSLYAEQPDVIDLVVSDLLMPRMDGLEMLQHLKRVRPHVRLVLLTASPADEQRWLAEGVYSWLSKTAAVEQLLEVILAALPVRRE